VPGWRRSPTYGPVRSTRCGSAATGNRPGRTCHEDTGDDRAGGAAIQKRAGTEIRATGGEMTRLGLRMIACALCATPALAGPTLSGEDAAYIDWGAKNCGTKSTAKEHAMVDQANAQHAASFMRKYQGTNLSDDTNTTNKQTAMCDQIKGWYGPGGSRIAGMITWENTGATTAAADKPASKSEGRRSRRRQPQ